MEYVVNCRLCGHDEAWTTDAAAEAAAVWHVYREHREVWKERMGTDEPIPVQSMSEDYGRRFEDWERQSGAHT